MEILNHMKTLKEKGDQSNQGNKPPEAKVRGTNTFAQLFVGSP